MLDITIHVTLIACFLAFIGVLIALFLWNRGESNNDRREMMGLIKSIEEEVKDFHNKLWSLEKQRRK